MATQHAPVSKTPPRCADKPLRTPSASAGLAVGRVGPRMIVAAEGRAGAVRTLEIATSANASANTTANAPTTGAPTEIGNEKELCGAARRTSPDGPTLENK